jgi:hypothetical protein
MSFIIVLLLAATPTQLDLPPEGIVTAANATITAQRGTTVQMTETSPPPTNTIPAFESDCAEMSWYRARAGLPARFDQIGWRESNCRLETGVRTSCCVGWLQLNVGLHLRDHRLVDRYHACGVWSYRDADGPGDESRHMCAAKALFDVVGYSAWSATS